MNSRKNHKDENTATQRHDCISHRSAAPSVFADEEQWSQPLGELLCHIILLDFIRKVDLFVHTATHDIGRAQPDKNRWFACEMLHDMSYKVPFTHPYRFIMVGTIEFIFFPYKNTLLVRLYWMFTLFKNKSIDLTLLFPQSISGSLKGMILSRTLSLLIGPSMLVEWYDDAERVPCVPPLFNTASRRGIRRLVDSPTTMELR